ncbi:hypothetical protein SNEBB_004342 [Seison nebaliae]|nr:hypothetical protein SNEBB_004342 [Seison nebaliae]
MQLTSISLIFSIIFIVVKSEPGNLLKNHNNQLPISRLLKDIERRAFDSFDKRAFDSFDKRAFDSFDKRAFDSFDKRAFDSFDKRNSIKRVPYSMIRFLQKHYDLKNQKF